MEHPYSAPCSYYIVYVYEIPGSVDHAGILKVGMTSFKTAGCVSDFPANGQAIRAATHARIKGHTNTAGIKYDLKWAELAVREVETGDGRLLTYFTDHSVHDVLEKSGFRHVKIDGTTGREWYRADLETVKNAIAAVKEGRIALDSSELRRPDPFAFREEQEAAVVQTLARFRKHADMLWDAKMRFGKTPTALEVVLRGGFRKTIIITHRPVVGSSWEEDFHKIFPGSKVPYVYVDKTKVVAKGYEAKEEADKKDVIRRYDRSGRHFIYFASIQDLRGSRRVGGSFLKNDVVFDTEWDLVIVDEAHEGTQTELGRRVARVLTTPNHTRVLSLSGTPYNLLTQYDDDGVFVWDYTQEQATKAKWAEEHPDEPNPYAVLPQMNIFTFDLAREMSEYSEEELEGKAFNFSEFFRTWTGDKDVDGKSIPAGAKIGDFVHADDVRRFLDLISTDSPTSRYPFSTSEYCDFFRHSLWMVPGVAAAKALSEMLKSHRVFKSFGVANVAGNGDEYEETHYEDALQEVRGKIRQFPRTITLSCGKLTTGVTVPEWTAVLMLSGSVHTAAASYMQTIFRVQSPWVHDGGIKEQCYVFDFAPDRALTVLAETAQITRRIAKDADKEEQGKKALREFMNFCPVIAIDGGRAVPYDVSEMMRRLKHVFVMRAIRNGFDDTSIYNNAKLLKLGKFDLKKFSDLEKIVGRTKQTEAVNSVEVNGQGFGEEDWQRKKREQEQRARRKLTPEELEKLKKRREELQRAKNARSILRAISIRMPMLIFGADVPIEEKITLRQFVKLVDDASWEEFMPRGVTKKRFNDFVEYYDPDVFEAAGLEIRKLAKSADKLPPGQRVQQIARIFGYFKNPDKETVLTPWRVVNMHMGDTLGGWCFFDETFDEQRQLDEPRHVDCGEVTDRVFRSSSKILEINSKSGLYPLYVAYSMYRRKCGEIPEQDIAPKAREKKWRETVADNVFVICKTPMAASITRRTLVGYSGAAVNTAYVENLVDMLKDAPEKFIKKIGKGSFWKRGEEEMKFDAVVGNPPYQLEGGSGGTSDSSLYQYFGEIAMDLNPKYSSLVIPARWFAGGRENLIGGFRKRMLSNRHVSQLFVYSDSSIVFPSVEIKGGVCYYLLDSDYVGDCEYHLIDHAGNRQDPRRNLGDYDILIRFPILNDIVRKVTELSRDCATVESLVSHDTPFGIGTDPGRSKRGGIKVHPSRSAGHDVALFQIERGVRKVSYVDRKDISKNAQDIAFDKVFIPEAYGAGETFPHQILGQPEMGPKNSVCTQSYLYVKFDQKKQAKNFTTYLKTRFFRSLVLAAKITQHSQAPVYRFVPVQDFSVPWDDEKLYKKYNLTMDEITFIESMVKPME